MSVATSEWVRLLEKEYLSEFIPAGGAAVKIAVVSPGQTANLLTELGALAQRERCLPVRVCARSTKVHMIHEMFFAISKQINWDALADRWLRKQFEKNGYELTGKGRPLSGSLKELAEQHGVQERDVLGRVNRWISNGILKNYRLGKEFRTAMAMLCSAQINPQDVSPEDADLVRGWLKGEKVSLAALKRVQIYGRITRHNARLQLNSLAQWLHLCGGNGLCLLLDASFVMEDILPGRAPIRYTRNTALDFYEVLRQFIDDTDEMEHLLVITLTGPGMLEHPKKKVDNYEALKLRTADEVRDRERANPLNALVRLTAQHV